MKWLTTAEYPFNPLGGLKLGETKEQLKEAALKAINANIPKGLKCAFLLEDYENEPSTEDWVSP